MDMQQVKALKKQQNNITNNVLTSASTLLMTGAFVVFFMGLLDLFMIEHKEKMVMSLKKVKSL